MDTLLKKLNYKNQPEIVILNMPSELQSLLTLWAEIVPVKTNAPKSELHFGMAFCLTQKEVDQAAEELAATAEGDAVLWMCYPKGSSKKYKCEFNRDNGWAKMGALGWEPVRMVSINEDWSALRFRKPDFIKTMSRSFAITEKGKAKAAAAIKKT